MEGKLSAALDLLFKKKQEYRLRMEGKLSTTLDLLFKTPQEYDLIWHTFHGNSFKNPNFIYLTILTKQVI